MQIICIYAGLPEYNQKLDYVTSIFNNTLYELGISIKNINLYELEINYFNGKKQAVIESIVSDIKNSDGIVMASTAQKLAPNAIMQVFLENLDYNLYGDILSNKPCLCIITSSDNSEYSAGNYISSLINSLEGISLNNMLIGKNYIKDIEKSTDISNMIEKYAEDFYRFAKQKRKLFIPSVFNMITDSKKHIEVSTNKNDKNSIRYESEKNNFESTFSSLGSNKTVKNLTGEQVANLYKKETENNTVLLNNNFSSSVNKNIKDYNSISDIYNDKDLDDISRFLEEKYKKEILNKDKANDLVNTNNISANITSIRQKTQSLYHYFQPQISQGLNIIMQVIISGDENFSGYFVIKNNECTYLEGENTSPDVTILSSSGVWQEVLDAKCTLQKAFMLGKLKVKGNFVLISRFEQFFKII